MPLFVGGDACIAPQAGARLSGPMTSIGPYSMGAEEFRPRRGQYGERAKSVKKNAALLHFLAFGPFDHNFGVPRGERLAAKTMAASLLRKPARAVIRPAGANIARSPVSPRSTVAPCSQPRNPLGRAAVRLRSNQSPSGALKHTSGPVLRDGGARCAPPSARYRK